MQSIALKHCDKPPWLASYNNFGGHLFSLQAAAIAKLTVHDAVNDSFDVHEPVRGKLWRFQWIFSKFFG